MLVHVGGSGDRVEDLDEFLGLVAGAGLRSRGLETVAASAPSRYGPLGVGKLARLRERVRENGAELAIFNHALSPLQERCIEQRLQCRVLDRTGLILDIFAQRARSYEGKLQVELAQLRHLSGRLVRGWTHLERQKGGIGLRGPGEKQLETDRRLIGDRIQNIHDRLRKVHRRRRENRRLRQRNQVPIVALVGYTNAGKSTLFNRLTGASADTASQPFVTLDPTLRRCPLLSGQHVVLADTIGFIRHLPTDLTTAFRAALEEICSADLLLQVVDCSDPLRHDRIEQVNRIIQQIGAAHLPQFLVYNKIDRVTGTEPGCVYRGTVPSRIYLSARSGAGKEHLSRTVAEFFWGPERHFKLHLPFSASRLRSDLFRQGSVLDEQDNREKGWILHLRVQRSRLEQLCRDAGVEPPR